MAKSISRRLADSASPTGAIDGTLSTAAQTNITSVGTLSALTVTGEITANGGIALPDDGVLSLGTSDELTLKHHNSGYSHLINTTGTLYVDSDSVTFRDDDGSPSNMVISQTGIDVTGDVDTSGLLKVGTNDSEYANNYIRFKSTGAAYIDHNTVGQAINFRLSNASSLDKTVMTLTSAGNVGIGTSSITNPYSQSNFTDVNIDGTWGGAISFKLGGATKGWVGQRSSGNADMVIGATTGEELLLYANNAEKMRVVHEGLRIGGGATAYTNTQFEIAAAAGVDRHSRSISSGLNSFISGSSQRSIMVEGVVAVDTVSAGTVLSIPHYSQPNLWRPFMVELMFVSGEYNRATGGLGGWAKCGYSALTSLVGFSQFEVGGNVGSVSISGMNLLVNFTSGYVNGLSNYEGVCMYYKVMSITPDYFQAWNATLN